MSHAQSQASVATMLSGGWWMLALRGVAAIIFGLLAIAWPGSAVIALIWLYGAYALVDGIFALIAAFRGEGRGWLLVLEGVLGVVAGLIALALPGVTAFVLVYLIAFWAIFTGIARIVLAISLRREIDNEWSMILGGVLTVLFGFLMAILPLFGILSLVLLIGIWAIIAGVTLLVLAFRMRGHRGAGTSSRVV